CGSGTHPCTQLCLEALERSIKPGDWVLDVGAGSGILLAAATAFGAGRAVGCDLDHDVAAAVDAPVFTGTADAVRDAAFDIVIANISAAAAEDLLDELQQVCKSGGTLIISGFEQAELPERLRNTQITERAGWCATMSHRPSSDRS